MRSIRRATLFGLLLAGFLALSGCVQRNKTDTSTLAQAAPPGETAGVVQGVATGPHRYYQDAAGQLYYVDSGGALHTIQKTVRVETGGGGLYYVIDENPIRYYADETGRLYYYTPGREVIYLEESGPGHVINPLPILSGSSVYKKLESGRSVTYCDSEWRKCIANCDEAPGLTNKRNCLDNCDYQKNQCLSPY